MEPTLSPHMPEVSAVIVPRQEIRRRVKELAAEISAAVDGTELTIVGVLDGVVIFLADLVRQLPMPVHMLTVGVRSYRGRSTTPGPVEFLKRIQVDLRDRHVLVLDDILDSGRTLAAVLDELATHRPASCRSCVLLRKVRAGAAPAVEADFVGFDVPDVFVVGYGLDFDGRYRNLPDVVTLRDYGEPPP